MKLPETTACLTKSSSSTMDLKFCPLTSAPYAAPSKSRPLAAFAVSSPPKPKISPSCFSVNRLCYRHTDTHRYATMFVASYDDATGKLRDINCCHNPPILLRRNSAERLPATATVLGLFQTWECTVAEVRLEPGDLLGIYTDGVTEAAARKGEEFGEARLPARLAEHRNLEPATILQKVEQAVPDFRYGEQADDLTLAIARAHDSGGHDFSRAVKLYQ